MLVWMVQNTLTIAVLVAIVGLMCRVCRLRPAVQHVLWVVVLIKFLTPAFVCWPWSLRPLCERVVPFDELGQQGRVASAPSRPGRAESRSERPRVGPEVSDVAYPRGEPGRALVKDETEILARVLTASGTPAETPGLPSWEPLESHRLPRRAGETNRSLVRDERRSEDGIKPWTLIPAMGFGVITWRGLLIGVWAVGAAVAAYREVRRVLKFDRVLRRSRTPPEWILRSVRELAATLGVREPRTLLVSGIRAPFVWCLGRPKLLWPESMADDAPIARWRGVIAHELAHLRRRDHWITWLELVAGCAWWWNPLCWFVRRRVRETAELACDAWAVWAVPDGQRAYAESLVEVARQLSRTGSPVPALGVSTGARRSFERRLTMILSESVPCKVSVAGMVGAALLAALALPAWSLGPSQRPASDAEPRAERPPASETGAEDAPMPGGRANETSEAAAASGLSHQSDATVKPSRGSDRGRSGAASAASQAPAGRASAVNRNASAAGATRASDESKLATLEGPQSDTDRIAKLERRLEALLIEVRALRETRGATGQSPSTTPADPPGAAAYVRNEAASPDGKFAALVGANGIVTLFDGESRKELRSINLGLPHVSSIDFTPDSKILVVATADGKVWWVEPSTGKLLSRSEPPAGDTSVPPHGAAVTEAASLYANRRAAASDPESPRQAETASRPALAQSLAGSQLDLIRLATEYGDAVGSAKLAQRRLDSLGRRGSRDKPEAEAIDEMLAAQVTLDTASNKVRVLRAIAEAAAEATKEELEYHRKLAAKGYAAPSNEVQYRAKLRILQLILGEETSSKPHAQ